MACYKYILPITTCIYLWKPAKCVILEAASVIATFYDTYVQFQQNKGYDSDIPQCWLTDGPPSGMLTHHLANIGTMLPCSIPGCHSRQHSKIHSLWLNVF